MADKKMTKREALEIAIEFLGETDCSAEVIDKLEGMIAQEVKRAEYAATHKKPSQAKGPGEATLAIAREVESVLTDTPMTSAEIAEALGKDYSPLRIANASKYIAGVQSQKVVREVVGKNGLRQERQYTAYFLA